MKSALLVALQPEGVNMVRWLPILCMAALVSPASAAPLCGYEASSIDRIVGDITRAGGRVVLDTADFIAAEEPRRMILWTFAKPKSGQFPAFICRQVVQTGDRIDVQLRAVCNGAKPECDALIASVLDQQQKATQHLRP
ncbi:hypothetical protein [Methylobacterium sp. 77]|uniref:hypothetical protein n=1 Tax=Methylobacterium sp. 77 TaxID=1101192 RepID=UPI0012DFA090|nr:hypothetical protein [Methylobacterium sp. 77]